MTASAKGHEKLTCKQRQYRPVVSLQCVGGGWGEESVMGHENLMCEEQQVSGQLTVRGMTTTPR